MRIGGPAIHGEARVEGHVSIPAPIFDEGVRNFNYRRRRTWGDCHCADEPMNVVIPGAPALIGSVLIPPLSRNGHTVRGLAPRALAERAARSNPDHRPLDESPLTRAVAVVHLARAA